MFPSPSHKKRKYTALTEDTKTDVLRDASMIPLVKKETVNDFQQKIHKDCARFNSNYSTGGSFYNNVNKDISYESVSTAKHKQYSREKVHFFSNSSDSHTCIIENRNKAVNNETKLKDLVTYFENILKSLKDNISDDPKDLVQNALGECEGIEVELCSQHISAHCVELLLQQCENAHTWILFMKAFAEQKEEVSTSPSATHITELLLNFSLQKTQNWSLFLNETEENEQIQTTFFLDWIIDFGEFLVENLTSFLENQHAAHVASAIVRTLGGVVGKDTLMSKNLQEHKKHFHQQFVGETLLSNIQKDLVLEEIPKVFSKQLKKILKTFLKIENMTDFVAFSPSATFIETLLFVLKKRHPKYCNKLILGLISSTFSEKDFNGIPQALIHKNSSYVVEILLQCMSEDILRSFWEDHLQSCFKFLLIHHVGNHIVQKFLDAIQDKPLFEAVSEAVINNFNAIFDSHYYGIFVAFSKACNRLKTQQAQFMLSILQCLKLESEDKQVFLIPFLLRMEPYDANRISCGPVACLQGSLLVQELLKFQKPIKLVRSLLSMSACNVAKLATHSQGCHAFTAFFNSATVGDKNKDKFLKNLQPELANLACDRNGSFTLTRAWIIMSVRQRAVLAEMLSAHERTLRGNSSARILFQKCSIFHFKRDRAAWERTQSGLGKKGR